jgi:hypothetical protein
MESSADEAGWQASNPRVLFLAKRQTTGPTSCGIAATICELFRNEGILGNRKTFEKTSVSGRMDCTMGWQTRAQSFDEADDDRRHSAAMLGRNQSEDGGWGKEFRLEIRDHARRFGALIMEQITLLSPTVIVCCGTFRFICEFLRDLPGYTAGGLVVAAECPLARRITLRHQKPLRDALETRGRVPTGHRDLSTPDPLPSGDTGDFIQFPLVA